MYMFQLTLDEIPVKKQNKKRRLEVQEEELKMEEAKVKEVKEVMN